MSLTAFQLNTYLSILIVTIIASGAALIIVHVGTAEAFNSVASSQSGYQDLGL